MFTVFPVVFVLFYRKISKSGNMIFHNIGIKRLVLQVKGGAKRALLLVYGMRGDARILLICHGFFPAVCKAYP